MVDVSEIVVGSKVLIEVGTNQFEAEVFDIETEDLFQVDGAECGLQVVTAEQILKILPDSSDEDDRPNPAPESERGYIPTSSPSQDTQGESQRKTPKGKKTKSRCR